MKIVRVYPGTDGESHLEDYEVPTEKSPYGLLHSKPTRVREAVFSMNENKTERPLRWHNASQHQFFVVLEGELFIEVADGTRRRIGPGEVLLAEDTTGHGHLTSGICKSALVVSIDDSEPKL